MPKRGRGSKSRLTARLSLRCQELDGMDVGEGVLQLGQTSVRCDSAGNVRGVSTKASQPGRPCRQRRGQHTVETSEDDAGWSDYIENISRGVDDGEDDQDAHLAQAQQIAAWNLDCTQDLLPVDDDVSSSAEAGSEDDSTSEYGSDVSLEDVVNAFSSKLGLEERYPVAFRSRLGSGSNSSSSALTASLRRAARKGGTGRSRMSCSGTAAPPDKAGVKRQKRKARRAARVQLRGLDVGSINQQMHDFVVLGGDLMAIYVVGKYGSGLVQKMGALYGLKCTIQGVSKRKSVMVSCTPRTALPEGEALARLQGLLRSHQEALLAMGPAIRSSKRRNTPPSRSAKHPTPSSFGRQQLQARYQAPVNFIASGMLDPNAAVLAMEGPSSPAVGTEEAMTVDSVPLCPDTLAYRPGISIAPSLSGSWSLGGGLLGTDGVLRTEPGCADATSSSPDWAVGGLGWDLHGSYPPAVEALGRPEGPGGCPAGLPPPLSTAARERAARKKREKVARRAARAADPARSGSPSGTGGRVSATSLEFGGFEQHTTGFGSRMLAKWGFEGQGRGLGPEGRGRAEPLQVSMRRKSLGLGA